MVAVTAQRYRISAIREKSKQTTKQAELLQNFLLNWFTFDKLNTKIINPALLKQITTIRFFNEKVTTEQPS